MTERGRPPYPSLLTPAEQRVLEELRRGGTNAEVAVRLGLSPETVKTHIASMLGKLDLSDRHELVAWRPGGHRRRLLGGLPGPASLASIGRPLLWGGVALGAAVVVAVVVVVLAPVSGGDEEPLIVVPETKTPSPMPTAPSTPQPGTPSATSRPEALSPTRERTLTCEGHAVPNGPSNPALVTDCELLLSLKPWLVGSGSLNWSTDTPLTNWTGVTIEGSPQRVTKLLLADRGLTGELLGWIGDLGALAELRLEGNALRGRIPSKLGKLEGLTHVYVGGNPFSGCLPASWETVANNDLATAGLPYCDPPIDASHCCGDLDGGRTYLVRRSSGTPPLVFDIPDGLRFPGVGGVHVDGPEVTSPNRLIFTDSVTGATLLIDSDTGLELDRIIDPRLDQSHRADIHAAFERLAASFWLDESGVAEPFEWEVGCRSRECDEEGGDALWNWTARCAGLTGGGVERNEDDAKASALAWGEDSCGKAGQR